MEEDVSSAAAAAPAASGVASRENKRLKDMTEAFDGMGIEAPTTLKQATHWYGWDGVVVVAVVPHHVPGSVWVFALDKSDSGIIYRRFDVSDRDDSPLYPIGLVMPLEKSHRWSSKISPAEAAAGAFDKFAIGCSKIEFLYDFHYNKDEQTMLGVDTDGRYQIWDLRSGAEIIEGRFMFTKGARTFGVIMNCICHTRDWIVAATALEETTCTIFAVDRASNKLMPPFEVAVTGLCHMTCDFDQEDLVWISTDSGPFTLDTRFPYCMWAILPGAQWIRTMTQKEKMYKSVIDVGRYMARFPRACQDKDYRIKLEKTDWSKVKPDVEVAEDLGMAHHFNTQRYDNMDVDIRPNYMQSTGNDELLTVSEKGFTWNHLKRNEIVPGRMAGVLSAATVRGGVVFVTCERIVAMVQNPWAKKPKEEADFSKQPVRRTLDDEEPTLVRFNETGSDTKYMIARATPTDVVVHVFDDGVYVFRVE